MVASLDLAWKRSCCHEGDREKSHWDHPFSAEISSFGPKYSFVSSLFTMKLTKSVEEDQPKIGIVVALGHRRQLLNKNPDNNQDDSESKQVINSINHSRN